MEDTANNSIQNTAENSIQTADEPSPEILYPALEALMFATAEPISSADIAKLLDKSKQEIELSLKTLQEKYNSDDHGISLIEIAGGWQFGTKPQFSSLIEEMLTEIKRVRLSPAALETLAIIAYRQPITRAEIEAIRGVNVDGVMKTLLDRELIRIEGKKEEVGRPLLYGTTENFLIHFGLSNLKALPPLAEYEEIAGAKAQGIEEKEDWYSITKSQREALDSLTEAAEKELSDLDSKLASLKPPKLDVSK